MIEAITREGMLHWLCYGGQEDEQCYAPLCAHVSEAVYRLAPGTSGPRGAVIDLPQCHACKAVCTLKADYSIRELMRVTIEVADPGSEQYVRVLKKPHVHNLMVHHWLYQSGKAEHRPLVGLPTPEALAHPQWQGVSATTVLALWFGDIVATEYEKRRALALQRRQAALAMFSTKRKELSWQQAGKATI